MIRQLFFVHRNAANLFGHRRDFTQTQQLRQTISGHTPNSIEKRFLVWTGKYKSIGEIPHHVSYEVMERCRNKIRIRTANIMMVLTIVGCCLMVYKGKQDAKSGESVTKQNLDWHKKYNEQQNKEGSK